MHLYFESNWSVGSSASNATYSNTCYVIGTPVLLYPDNLAHGLICLNHRIEVNPGKEGIMEVGLEDTPSAALVPDNVEALEFKP